MNSYKHLILCKLGLSPYLCGQPTGEAINFFLTRGFYHRVNTITHTKAVNNPTGTPNNNPYAHAYNCVLFARQQGAPLANNDPTRIAYKIAATTAGQATTDSLATYQAYLAAKAARGQGIAKINNAAQAAFQQPSGHVNPTVTHTDTYTIPVSAPGTTENNVPIKRLEGLTAHDYTNFVQLTALDNCDANQAHTTYTSLVRRTP